jgi:hypothetical protein
MERSNALSMHGLPNFVSNNLFMKHTIASLLLILSVSGFSFGENFRINQVSMSNGFSFSSMKRTDLKLRMTESLFTSSFAVANDVKKYGEGKMAFLKSLALPGWGMVAASGNKLWFAATPVCYGLLGYGIYCKMGSKKIYNEYLASTDIYEIQELYDAANAKNAQFFTMTYLSAFLYCAQACVTFVHGLYNDAYRERNNSWVSRSNMGIVPMYDFQTRSTNIRFSFNLRTLKK